jgi:hypothetical protein
MISGAAVRDVARHHAAPPYRRGPEMRKTALPGFDLGGPPLAIGRPRCPSRRGAA